MTLMTTDSPPKRTAQFWIILIGFVLISGGIWIGLTRVAPTEANVVETAPTVGNLAPEISLKTLQGETVNLSDFRGQPVLVNFWATWCGPCRIEMPEFEAVYQEQGDAFVLLAVNASAQDNGDVEGFVQELGLTFPILLDQEGEAMQAYQILGLPTSIFIDRDGLIQRIQRGLVNKDLLESILAEL